METDTEESNCSHLKKNRISVCAGITRDLLYRSARRCRRWRTGAHGWRYGSTDWRCCSQRYHSCWRPDRIARVAVCTQRRTDQRVAHHPWYMLASGVFGLILYLTITQTLPKLGATSAVLLIIVGQLLAGMVIDHFGLFDLPIRSIDLSRLLAAVLLITGAYLMVR